MLQDTALTRGQHQPSKVLAETIRTTPVDLERLTMKAHVWKEVLAFLKQEAIKIVDVGSVAKELEKKFKHEIHRIKEQVKQNIQQSHREMYEREINRKRHSKKACDPQIIVEEGAKVEIKPMRSPASTGLTYAAKNKLVDDMGKLVFDRRFKGFINHKEEILRKNQQRRDMIRERKQRNGEQEPDEFIVEDDILSNTEEDFEYQNAEDMQSAYAQIFNGKKAPSRVVLKHAKKYEYEFRKREYAELMAKQRGSDRLPKEAVLQYLFSNIHVIMLYSINPFTLGDELTDYPTSVPGVMTFEEFSCFLLLDRQPTFTEYSQEAIEEAKKIGKGIKCAPIIAKWIDNTGVYELLMAVFRHGDIFGRDCAERGILVSKIRKQATEKGMLDRDVILIVNINKRVPLSRLLFEIEYESPARDDWKLEDWKEYLGSYHRLETPDKDKIIQKEVLAGRYDVSYVFVVSMSVVSIVKECFQQVQKFAEYFVLKEALLDKIYKHPRYMEISNLKVRKEPYKGLQIETVEETLIRMYYEADEYCDLEEVVEFFTHRGRPRSVEYSLYLKQLELQMIRLEAQQAKRSQKETESTDSDSDPEYADIVKERRVRRFLEKIESQKKNLKADENRIYNVTIPVPFQMDLRSATKKTTIREQKLKDMLLEKELKLQEELKPLPVKEVPWFVKENRYEKMMIEEERVRRIRLEQFRAELLQQMVPMSERLTKPKELDIHCELGKDTYKFIARPLPWYCEVELLERINKAKADRRQKILEEIIVKHTSNDLPEGVKNMLQRHAQLEERRAQKSNVRSDSLPQYTFQPPKVKPIPNFKQIHENLKMDFESMKAQFHPTQPVGFDFEKRQRRQRSEKRASSLSPVPKHQKRIIYNEPVEKPPTTEKHEALVRYRRQQLEERRLQQQRVEEEQQLRLIKQDKFAPYVRQVLRKSNNLASSKKQQLDRLQQYKMQDREKKAEYEAKMLEIYAKVLNRPLLVENSGQYGENDVNRVSKLNYQQHDYRHEQQRQPEQQQHQQQYQQQRNEERRQEPQRAPELNVREPPRPPKAEKKLVHERQEMQAVERKPQMLQKQSPQRQLQHQKQLQEQQRLQVRNPPPNQPRHDETSDDQEDYEDGQDDDRHIEQYERMRREQQNRQGNYSDEGDNNELNRSI